MVLWYAEENIQKELSIMRLLFAEDEKSLSKAVTAILTKNNYSVDAVYDGHEALDYLAREGIIEGMGDSTFQGSRAMSRYEMASIVAKAMQKGGGSFGDKAVLDKLAAEYAGELDTLKKRVAAHDKDIQELKEKADRSSFMAWPGYRWAMTTA